MNYKLKFKKCIDWVAGKLPYDEYPYVEFTDLFNLKKHLILNGDINNMPDYIQKWHLIVLNLRKNYKSNNDVGDENSVWAYINQAGNNHAKQMGLFENIADRKFNRTAESIFNDEGDTKEYIEYSVSSSIDDCDPYHDKKSEFFSWLAKHPRYNKFAPIYMPQDLGVIAENCGGGGQNHLKNKHFNAVRKLYPYRNNKQYITGIHKSIKNAYQLYLKRKCKYNV